MSAFRTMILDRRSIGLLLIMAVLLSTLNPAHYHLHHIDASDSANHEHAIDLHIITDSTDRSHHDEDTSVFAATPDVIVKKGLFDFTPYLLLTILLVLLTIFDRIIARFGLSNTRCSRRTAYFSPPLRAPPRR